MTYRRIYTLLYALPLVFSVFSIPGKVLAIDFSGGGLGKADAPYLIANVEGLININKYACSATGVGAITYFKLLNDITLTGEWTPICTGQKFYGNFDGNFKTIHSLTITNGTDEIGLFSNNSGIIENLYLDGVRVKGRSHTGAISGINTGTISQVYAYGNIEGATYVAGLVGSNIDQGSINKSVFYGNVVVTEGYGAGIVADTNKPVTDSFTHSNISGPAHLGRVSALNTGGDNTNSYHIGSLTNTTIGALFNFPSATSFYSTFDFTNTWIVNTSTNNGHAHLRWQKAFGPWPKDITPLLSDSVFPITESKEVPISTILFITFNKPIIAVSGKNIIIKNSADNSIVETFPVTDTSKVSISKFTAIVRPTTILTANTTYYIYIDRDVFKDFYENTFYGISSPTSWYFTTEIVKIPTVESSTTIDILKDTGNPKTFSVGINGKIVNSGNESVSTRGFYINSKPSNPGEFNTNILDVPGPYTSNQYSSLAGSFNCGQNYYMRAYASNSAGTGYGEERSFSMECPVVIVVETPPNTGGGGNPNPPASGGTTVNPPAGGGGGGTSGGSNDSSNTAISNKDINSDGKVNKYDFALLMADWGKTGLNLKGDMNGDQKVDKYDFALLMSAWTN